VEQVFSNSHFGKNVVIPAGMPESRAMDGNFSIAQVFDSSYLLMLHTVAP